jgi:hypothetical protein
VKGVAGSLGILAFGAFSSAARAAEPDTAPLPPPVRCSAEGLPLEPAFRTPPDPAALEARFGPALAALVVAYADRTDADGIGGTSIVVEGGAPLPRTVRIPVRAPKPLDVTIVLDLGERDCLAIDLQRFGEDEGLLTFDPSVATRVEVAWRGRVTEEWSSVDSDPTGLGLWPRMAVRWDTRGAELWLEGSSDCVVGVGGDRDDGDLLFSHCLSGAWQGALARRPWPAADRAAIVALLARHGFDELSLDAQVALTARKDLSAPERATLGIPAPGSAHGTATIVVSVDTPGTRVAVNGVEARPGPLTDGRTTFSVPATGRAHVAYEIPSTWRWEHTVPGSLDTWLADGAGVLVSEMGVSITAPGPRCGVVPPDEPGAWECGDHPIAPGAPFPLRCDADGWSGARQWISVSDPGPRTGLSFVAATPGTYVFRRTATGVTFDHTDVPCPASGP